MSQQKFKFDFEFKNRQKNAVTGKKASGCEAILKVRERVKRAKSDSYYLQLGATDALFW